ncbi:AAA domain-containing protein [Micromonospora halotolerans]|uniref:AAA domain-containing protein n=1 Tax=Micromonospora halotolerans TaxID=709879 RepID=A0ABY9ZR35_9ACTN|nr:AAA domain-containing protein [Micromonospora halotolerans]WNM37583.1 AAA domain-containing protein [Micromonospora halotolerans]
MFAEQLRPGEIRIVSLPTGPATSVPRWLIKLADKYAKNREVVLRHRTGRAEFEVAPAIGGGQPIRLPVTDQETVDWLTAAGRRVVSWVVDVTPQQIGLQCHAFATADIGASMTVGIDDGVAEQVRIATQRAVTGFDPIRDWLREEFALPALPGQTEERFVHSGGPGSELGSGVRALTLHGRRWVADIALADDALRLVRLTDASSRQHARWFRLSPIDLRFVDRGDEAAASEVIRAALQGLTSNGRTYLDLWQAYNEIERESLVDEARRMGSARYRSCQVTADGLWRFELQPDDRAAAFLRAVASFSGRLQLEASANLPPELHGGRGRPGAGVHGEVRYVVRNNWTVDLAVGGEDAPPPTGHLFQSLSGDRVRLRRRDLARERIETDQAEMPGLRLLIEGVPRPGAHPRAERAHEKAIAAAINGSDGPAPTDVQRAALHMALRTPDVLLVQGPPGSGKTRFIADLLRCLDDLGERTVSMQRILLSSVQHDAVDNVARKARRHGLPPTRVGARPGRDWESSREWRDGVVATVERYLQEHRPASARHDAARKLRELASAYERHPMSGSDLVALLGTVKELAGTRLPGVLRDELDHLLADRAVVDRVAVTLAGDERERLAREARSLRVTAVAFADDGPQRAVRALRELDRLLDKPARQLLEAAAEVGDSGDGLLAELAALRVELLGRLAADTALLHAPMHDPDVEALLHLVADAVAEEAAETADSADEVLLAYRDDLREDLALVESTLARYNAVLASTVQQSNSEEMSRLLDAPLPVFDTVVVDEAARANPLDLMIPMAFARRRIVLVGDHKQLPHVLEQKVERELRRNRSLDGSELSQSLFERWFDLFADEKPAARTIVLDTQFRMHPALGRFVSEVFYGGPDVIKPDPSTARLTHELSTYAGKVAAWIDVPRRDGDEKRSGTSWTRPAEARRLVRELSELAELDRERRLSFGVITFYKAQQELLEAELQQAGLAVVDDDGTFMPVPAMQFTNEERPRQRLRVGTVDAFQGMEFDVVLLSVTRSSQVPRPLGGPAEAVQRYGHLLSDSRMCVAMSRQRRLLIAVGDAAMADRAATPELPGRPGRSVAEGIVAFREFCEGVQGAGVRT